MASLLRLRTSLLSTMPHNAPQLISCHVHHTMTSVSGLIPVGRVLSRVGAATGPPPVGTSPPKTTRTLIDELPYAAAAFTTAPDHIKAKMYAAFNVQVLYRQEKRQATIWATITITTATPGIVKALAGDPRTTTTPHPVWKPGKLPYSTLKGTQCPIVPIRHTTMAPTRDWTAGG
jgi:hypothetical protein